MSTTKPPQEIKNKSARKSKTKSKRRSTSKQDQQMIAKPPLWKWSIAVVFLLIPVIFISITSFFIIKQKKFTMEIPKFDKISAKVDTSIDTLSNIDFSKNNFKDQLSNQSSHFFIEIRDKIGLDQNIKQSDFSTIEQDASEVIRQTRMDNAAKCSKRLNLKDINNIKKPINTLDELETEAHGVIQKELVESNEIWDAYTVTKASEPGSISKQNFKTFSDNVLDLMKNFRKTVDDFERFLVEQKNQRFEKLDSILQNHIIVTILLLVIGTVFFITLCVMRSMFMLGKIRVKKLLYVLGVQLFIVILISIGLIIFLILIYSNVSPFSMSCDDENFESPHLNFKVITSHGEQKKIRDIFKTAPKSSTIFHQLDIFIIQHTFNTKVTNYYAYIEDILNGIFNPELPNILQKFPDSLTYLEEISGLLKGLENETCLQPKTKKSIKKLVEMIEKFLNEIKKTLKYFDNVSRKWNENLNVFKNLLVEMKNDTTSSVKIIIDELNKQFKLADLDGRTFEQIKKDESCRLINFYLAENLPKTIPIILVFHIMLVICIIFVMVEVKKSTKNSQKLSLDHLEQNPKPNPFPKTETDENFKKDKNDEMEKMSNDRKEVRKKDHDIFMEDIGKNEKQDYDFNSYETSPAVRFPAKLDEKQLDEKCVKGENAKMPKVEYAKEGNEVVKIGSGEDVIETVKTEEN